MGSMIENSIKLFMIFSITVVLFAGSAFAQDTDDRAKLLAEAQEPFLKGEYENAIKIYDEILGIYPTDSEIFEMKGLALSNLTRSSVSCANAEPVKSTAVMEKIINNFIEFSVILPITNLIFLKKM